jgi:hypothetical protein
MRIALGVAGWGSANFGVSGFRAWDFGALGRECGPWFAPGRFPEADSEAFRLACFFGGNSRLAGVDIRSL